MSKRKRSKKRLPKTRPGTTPGALNIDPQAPKPIIKAFAYNLDSCIEKEITHLDQLKTIMNEYPNVWINVDGLGDMKVLTELGGFFNIHLLALEDVVNVHQQTKIEPYEAHLFIVMRLPVPDEHANTQQVSLFLGKGYLLTFQEQKNNTFDPVRERLRQGKGRIRKSGVNYLAYAIIDTIIDSYFPILETIEQELERLEFKITESDPEVSINHVLDIKRDVYNIRRDIAPQRDILNILLQDRTKFFTEDTKVFLRDCYDHAIRLIEMVELQREFCSDLVNLYMANTSNRMNAIMKVLTIISTTFIPLTFIAGLYGMNFNTEASPYNMPELNWYLGYPFSLLLMAGAAFGMLLFFRWMKWL